MAWFTRFTRFGDVHLVYAQEQQNSCGIACVMMTVFKINKLTPGVRALHTEREIYGVYSRVSHTNYNGSSYSYATHLASTLNQLRVGKWKAENVGTSSVTNAILRSVGTVSPGPVINLPDGHYPIIVLVGWNSGGAHFVVVDTVVSFLSSNYASVCDPWDGDVHVTTIQSNQTFNYVGAAIPWSWDLGGIRRDYSSPTPGGGNGWIVHRIS
ncbi:MAG: hypothetical protein JO114_02135 [Planctomycetaceae bacterium]|nr:hypothetical protein [Planctomycetaceae bacterium]MBV8312965.1 hypothetical protein [Planctomycetaceae bacterium]